MKHASALIIIEGKQQSPETCTGRVTFLSLPIPAFPSPQPKPCMLFKFIEFLIKFEMSYSDPPALGIKSKCRTSPRSPSPAVRTAQTRAKQACLPGARLPCYNLPHGELNSVFPACVLTSKTCASTHSSPGLHRAASRTRPYFMPCLLTQRGSKCSSEFQQHLV